MTKKDSFGPIVRSPAAKQQTKEIGLSDFAEELGELRGKIVAKEDSNYADLPSPENPEFQEGL